MVKTKIKYLAYITFTLAFNSTGYSQSFIVKVKEGQKISDVLAIPAGVEEEQMGDSEVLNSRNLYPLKFPENVSEEEIKKIVKEIQENENVERIEEDICYYIDTLDNEVKSPTYPRRGLSGLSQSTSSLLKPANQLSPELRKCAKRFSSCSDQDAQWSRIAINAVLSKYISIGSPEVKIALLDTGIDKNHRELVHSYDNDFNGLNIPNNNEDISDLNGHGTHCAGIIVGSGSKRSQEDVCGIAPLCKLIPIKVMSRSESKLFALNSWIIRGIEKAIEKGAKVISMSFSSTQPSEFLAEAIKDAQIKGCLIVAAAGNDNTDRKTYPAAYEGVLSVGAIDNKRRKLKESNYGDWVSVCAPGKDIQSTFPGNEIKKMDGTSMACPHVSALAGLLFSLGGENITAMEVKEIIESTCIPLNDSSICQKGLINIYEALETYCKAADIDLFSSVHNIDIDLGNRTLPRSASITSRDRAFSSQNENNKKSCDLESVTSKKNRQKEVTRHDFEIIINQNQLEKLGVFQVNLSSDQSIKYEISIYNVDTGKYDVLIGYKKYKKESYCSEDKTYKEQITILVDNCDNKYTTSERRLKIRLSAKKKIKNSLLNYLTKKNKQSSHFKLVIEHSKYLTNKIGNELIHQKAVDALYL